MDEIQLKIPWYKRPLGVIFLIISILLSGVTLAFLILLGYYLWNIRFGDSNELTKKFNNHFTFRSDVSLEDYFKIDEDTTKFIKKQNPTLGSSEAPVTIITFMDFECPYSQESFPIFKKVTEKYGSAVRVVFKQYPLTSIHENAMQAALASSCANDQNKFWEYYDMLLRNKKLETDFLVLYAKELDLNMNEFQSCLISQKNRVEIEEDLRDGIDLGVRGTPTYIVNKTKVEGSISLQDWDNIILKEIQKSHL